MATRDFTPGSTVSADELRDLVAAWCISVGFSITDSGTVADVVTEADICGAHSHGIRLLVSVREEILAGTIDPEARPTVLQESDVVTLLDGNHGFGPVACTEAVARVVDAARRSGIAAVSVRRSSHWGRPAYYGRIATEQDTILIGISNSAAAMPLWGTGSRSVGNNPIVIAVPSRNGDPLVLDISMQVAAWGKVRLYRDAGERLPGAWGYTHDGTPTDDPNELLASGRIRPMGDHKGSALAVMFEMLTAGLAGGLHSVEISEIMESGGPQHKSQLFIALDARHYSGSEALDRVVSSYARLVAGLEPLPGGTGPRLPGKGSAATRRRSLSNGVMITKPLADALQVLTGDLN